MNCGRDHSHWSKVHLGFRNFLRLGSSDEEPSSDDSNELAGIPAGCKPGIFFRRAPLP